MHPTEPKSARFVFGTGVLFKTADAHSSAVSAIGQEAASDAAGHSRWVPWSTSEALPVSNQTLCVVWMDEARLRKDRLGCGGRPGDAGHLGLDCGEEGTVAQQPIQRRAVQLYTERSSCGTDLYA